MNRSNILATICFVAVAAVAVSPQAMADQWNKKTTVTFSQPVEIPGVGAQILPAGTYVFKLLDSLSDRHIVQIFNTAEDHVYATILAIPNYRLRPTDQTVITFTERPAGSPEAIRAWFYPGDNSGQEFVYPKERAIELARLANVPVLAMPTDLAPNLIEPITEADEPAFIALKQAPIEAVRPTGDVVEYTEVVEAPPVQTAELRPVVLPNTASLLPLAGLIGLLSLGAGFTIMVVLNRAA